MWNFEEKSTRKMGSEPLSIIAADALGSLIWRIKNKGRAHPRFHCMSHAFREELRALAAEFTRQVALDEIEAEVARKNGNPEAFFSAPLGR
jgi:hypothetical protein